MAKQTGQQEISFNSEYQFIHKLSGEPLRIKRDFGSVCSCYTSNPIIVCEKPYLETNVIVCLKENLLPNN